MCKYLDVGFLSSTVVRQRIHRWKLYPEHVDAMQHIKSVARALFFQSKKDSRTANIDMSTLRQRRASERECPMNVGETPKDLFD